MIALITAGSLIATSLALNLVSNHWDYGIHKNTFIEKNQQGFYSEVVEQIPINPEVKSWNPACSWSFSYFLLSYISRVSLIRSLKDQNLLGEAI